MAKATTKAEVGFALSFLKYAGVKDPRANAYLILAVIAWLRQESGGLSRVIGNNPFNIRSSPFAIGYRQTKGNGKFAIFASLDAGARATIALLKSDGANGWRGYGAIIRALTKNTQGGANQAIAFLTAVALSRWDAAHYGAMVGQDTSTYDGSKNHLIQVWMGMTGQKVNIPAEPVKPPKVPKPKKIQPDDKLRPFPKPDYIEPYAAYNFYVERQPKEQRPPGE